MSSSRGATRTIHVIFHPQLGRAVCKHGLVSATVATPCYALAWIGKNMISMNHQLPSLQFVDLWFIKHQDSLVKVPSDHVFFLSYFIEQVLIGCLPGVLHHFFLKVMHKESFILYHSSST